MTPEPRPADLPTLAFERALWKDGFRLIAGIDEAGRGALAGPVAAAAVILPDRPGLAATLSRVRDSKLMTPAERERWAPSIRLEALAWGVGRASADEIDSLGILPATRLAARRALESLPAAPDALITDYLLFSEVELPQIALIKGDRLSLSVAAASVLAKTARDAWMRDLEGRFPGYGFARHKGYGTRLHREAILRLGPCPIHRDSFSLR
jgi:ribonuclease HII